jgi:hypothetical protein
MSWERIDDILTDEGKQKLKAGTKGDVLIFDFEGSPIYLKVRRKDKDGAIWAERLDPKKYLTPEQADQEVEIISKKK